MKSERTDSGERFYKHLGQLFGHLIPVEKHESGYSRFLFTEASRVSGINRDTLRKYCNKGVPSKSIYLVFRRLRQEPSSIEKPSAPLHLAQNERWLGMKEYKRQLSEIESCGPIQPTTRVYRETPRGWEEIRKERYSLKP
jgi:hypothetical protein